MSNKQKIYIILFIIMLLIVLVLYKLYQLQISLEINKRKYREIKVISTMFGSLSNSVDLEN